MKREMLHGADCPILCFVLRIPLFSEPLLRIMNTHSRTPQRSCRFIAAPLSEHLLLRIFADFILSQIFAKTQAF